MHRPLRIVVAGGGPAAVEAALALRELGGMRVYTTLVSPDDVLRLRPLSVVEPFGSGRAGAYPLATLGELGVPHRRDSVTRVDTASRTVSTSSGAAVAYDALVMATGAVYRRGLPNALTFTGFDAVEPFHGIVQDLEAGALHRLAFVAPAGSGWTLPLYELVLQTAERVAELGLAAGLIVVTREARPVEALGDDASSLVERLLEEAGVQLITGAVPVCDSPGQLRPRAGADPLHVDRIVALPVPAGRVMPGLPADGGGFIPVDRNGRVRGVAGVYAAGDGTSAPVKQGGLATQAADVAAHTLLADAGLRDQEPVPAPVLRAMLIAGSRAYHFRRELRPGARGVVSERPLWWPPSKIAGRHLAPFLDDLDVASPRERAERRFERQAARRAGMAVVRRRTPGIATEEVR